ncbi:histidine kinase [Alloacidobacterium dinghuense]|uniref:Histidine kinase n=1 Tax=Alloacidobacterium dinghuense TaxID=2763107 RepID=A0A7G8BNH3_9BACT|nr:histidine kinase [Alloacidobacterium dinghuense]QNI34093.1 histidine kinase [Alloacidobacterium dinghuense]
MTYRGTRYRMSYRTLLVPWCLHFMLWGIFCLILWWKFRPFIKRSTTKSILLWVAPLSVFVSVLEEAIWVACQPQIPLGMHKWTYWHRLQYFLDSELLDNLIIFWVTFCLFRVILTYQSFREREFVAAQQLTQAQLRALRMQLNPHFLFNTMNSVSSLMRSDMEAADQVLEQLSSMLRITLDRGDQQLVPLTEEVDFIQLYLGIQRTRFHGTVHHYVAIEPEALDALVPTMILQPIVENAYVHGVAKTAGEAFIGIEAQTHEGQLRICVRNSGKGLALRSAAETAKERVGVANVKARLELHYGNAQCFELKEYADGEVQAILLLPLQYPARLTDKNLEYAYDNPGDHR